MKRKDIDIHILQNLLETVPEEQEVVSVDLTGNNYKVNVVFDLNKANDEKYELSLSELAALLKRYDEQCT